MIKLSLRYVFRKKTQFMIMLVATVLATLLFFSVLHISRGLCRTIQEDAGHRYGDFSVGMAYADSEAQSFFRKTFSNHGIISKDFSGYLECDGQVFCLWSVSNDWYECFDCDLTEGEYPRHEGEILVPDDLPGVSKSDIGKTVSATVFMRSDSSGQLLDERYGVQETEQKTIVGERHFTVVGIYKNDGRACINSVNALCFYECEEKGKITKSFLYTKAMDRLKFDELENRYPVETVFNKDYLTTVGYSGGGESVLGSIIMLCTALIFLVAIAVLLLVGNAFSLSYKDQARELGVLSSVGGTRKQLRALFILEAFWVSATGLVLGNVLGYILVRFCVPLFGEKLLSICYVNTDFVFPSPFISFAASGALTLLVSLLAILWPLHRLRNTSALELIRESFPFRKNHQLLKVRLRTVIPFLAKRYRIANKTRYRIMYFSLGASAVILLLSLGLCNAGIQDSEAKESHSAYDVFLRVQISSETDFSGILGRAMSKGSVNTEKSYWYIGYNPAFVNSWDSFGEQADLISIPRNVYDRIAGELRGSDLLAAKNVIRYSVKGDSVVQKDESLFSKKELIQKPFEDVGALSVGCIPWDDICQEYPYFAGIENSFFIFPDDSVLLRGRKPAEGCIFLFAENHRMVAEAFEEEEGVSVHDLAADYDQQKTDMIVMKAFLYVFMALVFAVCYINMFFTVYSHHKLREKDYFTLQTLGMDSGQTDRMIRIECVNLGLATILTTIIGTVVIGAILKFVAKLSFTIPMSMLAVVVGGIIIAHFLAYMVVSRRFRSVNMIETIRECM